MTDSDPIHFEAFKQHLQTWGYKVCMDMTDLHLSGMLLRQLSAQQLGPASAARLTRKSGAACLRSWPGLHRTQQSCFAALCSAGLRCCIRSAASPIQPACLRAPAAAQAYSVQGHNNGEVIDREFFDQHLSGGQNSLLGKFLWPDRSPEDQARFGVEKEDLFRSLARALAC